jgi:DNA primase
MRAWLERALESSQLSEEARYYLMGRGATTEIIEKWGFKCFDPPEEPCPQRSLHRHYGEFFERVEGKVIYPLYSPRGKLLGFDSRMVDEKDNLRFLLGDAHWNPTWVGMPEGMAGIWDRQPVYVVEGIFDVFALKRIVKDGVVLGSGPARLSHKQIEFFRRWRPEVSIVYDQDDTGKRGTELALKNLRYHGVSCRKIPYRGKDPGDLWDKGGEEALREAFPYI